jgi:hypothetical protein
MDALQYQGLHVDAAVRGEAVKVKAKQSDSLPRDIQPADPPGTEAELFSLYQEVERGTSWF